MEKRDFRGLGVALITPFKQDFTVDFDSLGRILDHIIDGDADYIVVLGTTGEVALLSAEEKKAVMDHVRTRTAGRVPLVLGFGGNNTVELVKNLQTLDLNGYSAILSVAPFYLKPSQEGLYRHYKTLSEHSPVPVILYNVPGRTGCNLSARTTLRLATDCSNIVAIKEASGNRSQIEEIIKKKPEGFQVLSGDDGLAYPLMMLGASGVISVIGNAYPADFSKMTHLCLSGEVQQAKKLHYKYIDLIRALFEDGNPGGIKNLMSQMGFCEEVLRLPLVRVKKETAENIRRERENLRK